MKLLRFLPGEPIPGFDSPLLAAQNANEHLGTSDGHARCSLWWNDVPEVENEKPGIIGHLQADSIEAGAFILEQAAVRLREQGCTMAVGPMDGNTWRRYRVLTQRGSEPAFFMEPDNPDFWPTLFTSARFVPLATYSSSLVTDLSRRAPGAERAGKRLEQAGIQIRNLDPTHIEEDLRRIYHVSVSSFSRNFLYQEIPEAAFLAQYLPLKEHVRPELVLIAELNDRPAGYFFSIPDYAEAMRDQPVRTVIGKTLAVLPGRQFAGLGILLTGRLHERAKSLGYTRVIHALEHDANPSRNISNFFGAPMRRYALYSRRLT